MHSSIFAISKSKDYDIENLPSDDTEIYEDMSHIADYVNFEYDYANDMEIISEFAEAIARSIPGATSENNKIHIEDIQDSIRTLLKNKIDSAANLLDKKRNDEDITSMKTSIYQALEILHDIYGWYVVDLDNCDTVTTYDRFLGDLEMEKSPLDLYVIASYDYHF